MNKYLVSVDGGGTKTEFCIADTDGRIIRNFFKGPSNHNQLGLEKMYRVLHEGFSEILENHKIEIESITYAVFAMGGLETEVDYKNVMEEVLRLGIPKEKIHLCSDGLLPFYGVGEEPGIVIISGTGSIVFGLDRFKNIIRSGGWGHPYSSLGSGFFIGNELLKRTLLYCDGNYEYSALFQDVLDFLKADDFKDLPYKISSIESVAEIASFSKIVTEDILMKNALSLEILDKASGYLSDDVAGVYKRLDFYKEESVDIVLSGGCFKSHLYRDLLKEKIIEKIPHSNILFKELKSTPARESMDFVKKLYEMNKCAQLKQ